MKKPVAVLGSALSIILGLCLCLSATQSVQAQTYSPFQFLRWNYSARSSALAEATVAAIDDASNVVLNPASTYMAPTGRLALTYVKNVVDINSGTASYIGSVGEGAKWSAQVNYQSMGSFVGKDERGVPTGKNYSVGGVSIGGSYANQIDSGFYYGVGLHFLSVTLADQSSSALSLDAGLLYHIPNSRWNVGLAITNLGGQLSKINSTPEPLPTDVRLGVNHRLRGLPLLVNFSFNHLVDQNTAVFDHFKNFSIGGELYLGKVIDVRLGYNNSVHSGASFPTNSAGAGVNFGVGIKLKPLNLDYAMTNLVSGVSVHRISVLTTL